VVTEASKVPGLSRGVGGGGDRKREGRYDASKETKHWDGGEGVGKRQRRENAGSKKIGRRERLSYRVCRNGYDRHLLRTALLC
jgi:hypothetical protein